MTSGPHVARPHPASTRGSLNSTSLKASRVPDPRRWPVRMSHHSPQRTLGDTRAREAESLVPRQKLAEVLDLEGVLLLGQCLVASYLRGHFLGGAPALFRKEPPFQVADSAFLPLEFLGVFECRARVGAEFTIGVIVVRLVDFLLDILEPVCVQLAERLVRVSGDGRSGEDLPDVTLGFGGGVDRLAGFVLAHLGNVILVFLDQPAPGPAWLLFRNVDPRAQLRPFALGPVPSLPQTQVPVAPLSCPLAPLREPRL